VTKLRILGEVARALPCQNIAQDSTRRGQLVSHREQRLFPGINLKFDHAKKRRLQSDDLLNAGSDPNQNLLHFARCGTYASG
jgi:hypothetical protein